MKAFVAANPQHHDYHTDISFQKSEYSDGAVSTIDHDVVQTLKQAILVLQSHTDPASNPHGFTPQAKHCCSSPTWLGTSISPCMSAPPIWTVTTHSAVRPGHGCARRVAAALGGDRDARNITGCASRG